MSRIEYKNPTIVPPRGIWTEQGIAQIERKLSGAALIPIVGTVTGVCKMLLGIIQMIGGLLAMVCSLPFLITENGRSVFKRGFSHLCNGLGNVGAGLIEAIPIVGSLVSYYRIFQALIIIRPMFRMNHTIIDGRLFLAILF